MPSSSESKQVEDGFRRAGAGCSVNGKTNCLVNLNYWKQFEVLGLPVGGGKHGNPTTHYYQVKTTQQTICM